MKVDFKAKQQEFSAYIRDPSNNPQPADVSQQRMNTYRELFFNNIDSFLSSNFPVIKTILNDQQWFELVQDFFSKHPCQTPYFSEIPEEFLEYLQNERQNNADYPFLLELAHYEWVEMALSIAKDEITANTAEFINDISQQTIALSPLAWPLVYQFPVQQISPEFLPEIAPKEPSYLLVYRNIEDEVHFLQTPAITFRLLQILQENKAMSCEDCLQQIAQESAHPEPETIIAAGLKIIKDLAEKNIILYAITEG
ncbi:MAG: putative DNA-binding domain-containing protein [Methylococcales bacterium]|nr:putative DNA-binding domain-containing protein [Methylococcales bacterium]